MRTLWKYSENTFESSTRSNFKLMNILLTDHAARCVALHGAAPGVTLLADARDAAALALAGWRTAFTAWDASLGQYKGATQAFHEKLKELAKLKIRQWSAAIQAVYLEKTPEYVALLPDGRAAFALGAYDLRVARVRALATGLGHHPALAALKTDVEAFLAGLDTLRDAQQRAESAVDTLAAALEVQRRSAATTLYENLARFMLHWARTPARVEDAFDMNYLRSGKKRLAR